MGRPHQGPPRCAPSSSVSLPHLPSHEQAFSLQLLLSSGDSCICVSGNIFSATSWACPPRYPRPAAHPTTHSPLRPLPCPDSLCLFTYCYLPEADVQTSDSLGLFSTLSHIQPAVCLAWSCSVCSSSCLCSCLCAPSATSSC